MEKEDEDSKKLKNRNLAGRKAVNGNTKENVSTLIKYFEYRGMTTTTYNKISANIKISL